MHKINILFESSLYLLDVCLMLDWLTQRDSWMQYMCIMYDCGIMYMLMNTWEGSVHDGYVSMVMVQRLVLVCTFTCYYAVIYMIMLIHLKGVGVYLLCIFLYWCKIILSYTLLHGYVWYYMTMYDVIGSSMICYDNSRIIVLIEKLILMNTLRIQWERFMSRPGSWNLNRNRHC